MKLILSNVASHCQFDYFSDEKAAPIENSCRSLDKSLDSHRVVYVPVNLQSADNENQPAGECSAPELSPETGTGGSEEEVRGGPADEQVQGSEEEGGERVTIQKKEEKICISGIPSTFNCHGTSGNNRNPEEPSRDSTGSSSVRRSRILITPITSEMP